MRTIVMLVVMGACVSGPEPTGEATSPVLDLAGVRPDLIIDTAPRLAGLADAPLDGSGLVDSDGGRIALSVVVGCALALGDELDAEISTGDLIAFPGDLGIAPGWRHHPIRPTRAELVTACALALLSLEGLPAVISLRARHLQITPDEREGFPVAEGRYFGNAIGAGPAVLAACRGRGQLADPGAGGLVLRRCATPDPARPELTLCGLAYAGDCAAVCRGGQCEIGGRSYPAVAAFVAP